MCTQGAALQHLLLTLLGALACKASFFVFANTGATKSDNATLVATLLF